MPRYDVVIQNTSPFKWSLFLAIPNQKVKCAINESNLTYDMTWTTPCSCSFAQNPCYENTEEFKREVEKLLEPFNFVEIKWTEAPSLRLSSKGQITTLLTRFLSRS